MEVGGEKNKGLKKTVRSKEVEKEDWKEHTEWMPTALAQIKR